MATKTNTNTEAIVLAAEYQEVLNYLRSHDYKFSEEQRRTALIKLPKSKVKEGTDKDKLRKLTKALLEQAESEKQYLTDYEKLAAAFASIEFPKRSGGAARAGKPVVSLQDYLKDLSEAGVNSSQAGVLTINVAKIFEFTPVNVHNRKGENISGFETRNFTVSFDAKNKTLQIKMKK